ncbi:MAG: type II toxin-antitoxin system RelE/ParE family toxin [Acidobacteria bacterium]|nr:type II toxin-antitoxin system RelE/ParE family toxin [Acidobacteriota bacterium]
MLGVYSLRFKSDAERELERLPKSDLKRIRERIDRLQFVPRPPGCAKLGDPSIFRVRQGDYRIIYQVDDARRVVEVLTVAHRREAYR